MSTASEAGQGETAQAKEDAEDDADVVIVNGSPETDRVSGDAASDAADESVEEMPEAQSSTTSDSAANPATDSSTNTEVSDDDSTDVQASADTEADVDASSGVDTDRDPAPESTPDVQTEQPSSTTDDEEQDESDEDQSVDEDAVNEGGAEGEADDEPTDILDLTAQPETFSLKAEAEVLKEIVTTVDKVVDEFRLRMTESELRIRAVDAANVSMVDQQIDSDAFESFTATPGVLGIPLDSLKDVISLADRGDYISMVLNPDTRKLEIQVDDLNYTLGLIDPNTIRQDPDLPNLSLPAEVLIKGDTLDQGLTAAHMVSKHVEICTATDLDGITIKAEGDTDDMVQTLRSRDLVDCQAPNENISSMFALEYLSTISRALPRSDPVTMHFGDGFPIKINYEGCEGAVETTFMLAPRIQAD